MRPRLSRATSESGGSDGLPSRANTQFPGIPLDADWIVRSVPARRHVGASKRDALLEPRPRKVNADRRARIWALAAENRSLRDIAAEVGVSHEAVRAAL